MNASSCGSTCQPSASAHQSASSCGAAQSMTTWKSVAMSRDARAPRRQFSPLGGQFRPQLVLVQGAGQRAVVLEHLAEGRPGRAGHLPGRVPQPRAHHGLGALEVGLADADQQQRPRPAAELGEVQAERVGGQQLRGPEDPQRLLDPRDEEQQRRPRGGRQVAQAVDPVVALPVGQHQPVRVEHLHEAGVAAAGGDVGPAVGVRGRERGEGGQLDEAPAVDVEVVDLLVLHQLRGRAVAGEDVVHGEKVATVPDVTVSWSSPVRYVECDQQGVVFNGHYLTWADEASTVWWAAIGLPWETLTAGGGEPVVKASTLEWSSSARWGDTVVVAAGTEKVGRTSVTVRFTVRVGERVCCVVRNTYVWLTGEGPAPWPDDVRAKLAASTA